ncbi:D-methionine-binding lipoprotein MetQ [Commensalibacter sp. Nvir]|uniref:MetQ/NlpA family ABC transporter substrate-binding protein n=1 Tax=Commensalibacter sp. Nvir TaxID=3069817 RepID=UPI002D425086|nr:D-methionine-binding lipoprotein MetQ [Commensalibacter sp. Nvir]
MVSKFSRRALFVSAFVFSFCYFGSSFSYAETMKTLKVGVVSGPEEELAIIAKNIAKTKGIDVQLVNFDDYNLPNEALVGKDIDANAFQTLQFLNAQIKARGYKLAVLGKTWIEPMGFYSNKIKKIQDLPNNAKIGVPNDPSNQGRALNVLAKNHLIALNKNAPALPSLGDIIDNPHHFQFVELDGSQLARALDDLTMTAINTNYLLPAGIDPSSVLIQEGKENNPYANILVVRQEDAHLPEMKLLVESFQSDAVKKAMTDKFKGAILPAW